MADPRIKNVPDPLYKTAKRIALDTDRTVREVVIEALMLLARYHGHGDGLTEPTASLSKRADP